MIVAIAAPCIPIFNTIINNASNAIFVKHPVIIIVAESLGLPSPLIALLKTKPNKLNTLPNNIIFIYAFAYGKLPSLAPNKCNIWLINVKPTISRGGIQLWGVNYAT